MRPDGFWRSCGIPVAVCLVVFFGCNAAWNYPAWRPSLNRVLPYPIASFMLAGSGLALVFVTRALRSGWLTRHDLGLGLEGWTAPRRLAGLALLVLISYGRLALLQNALADQPEQPTWGDFSFNYFVCLSASLAEMLVFVGVTFCWVERWLRQRGTGRVPAAAAGLVLAAVPFGLYHYTHDQRWHAFILPLVAEMGFIVLFFLATRNFWLAVAVHNAFAATGFTVEQYNRANPLRMGRPEETAAFVGGVVVMAVAFLLPCLYLHWLEWRGGPAAPPKAPAG